MQYHLMNNSFYVFFTLLLLASAAITLGLGLYAFRRRGQVRGAGALTLQMAGTTWWTLSYALTIATLRWFPEGLGFLPAPMFWFRTVFMGVVISTTAFFIFTLQFVDQGHWVNRYTLGALLVEPVLVTILVWTDPHHQLFFAGYLPGAPGGLIGGIGFWAHSLYSYLLLLGASGLLIWSLVRGSPLQRRQSAILILGICIASASNLLTIFKVVPAGIDLTPVGFMVIGLFMVYNIRGQGFLDLIPVARNAVVEAMSDAVLVINRDNRVLDSNPAVVRLLRQPGLKPGRHVAEFFAPWTDLSHEYADQRRHFTAEVPLGEDMVLEVQVTPLSGKRGEYLGRILVLRDISPMKRIEAALRAQLAHNEQLRSELQELVVRDALTGLYNRRFLEQTLIRELAQAQRGGRSLALSIIDIDKFKPINDDYGHNVGDCVIKGLASLLLESTRAGDMACRFGGEEFVLVMPEIDLEVAVARVNQLREQFATMAFAGCDDALRATFSGGVACFPAHGSDAQSLLVAADHALYAAKAAGRNQVSAAVGQVE